MYGLPKSTEVKRSLPKSQLYKKFELKQSQRDSIDKDIARMDFVNLISSQTLPVISDGNEVKSIFVVEIELKRSDYAIKNIALIAKLISQQIVFALRYGDKVQLALYHTKFFTLPWYDVESVALNIDGLNLDAVWQNIVTTIADMEIANGNSLNEQIKENEQRAKTLKQIALLEKEMRSTSQTRRQREIYFQIKKLKNSL